MKKKLLITFITGVMATFTLCKVAAQESVLLAYNSKRHTTGVSTTSDSELSPKKYAGVYVRAKVMRTFLQYFDGATDVHWNLSGNRYLASFTNAGRMCKALFGYNGRLLYIIQYVTEKNLPREMRKQLRSAYVDYKIGAVTEVDANDVKAWIVNLQDADNLIVVRVTDGSLDELHRYKTRF
jgi:hypothetical protein